MEHPGHKQSVPSILSRFSGRHARALPSLATNRLLSFAASSLLGVFFPIFLYEFFGKSMSAVVVWYTILYGVRFPVFVWAAKIFSKIGLTKSMVLGSFGFILFYFAAYLLDIGVAVNPYVLLGTVIVGWVTLSAFYWSPYHVDMATLTKRDRRGRELGLLYSAERAVGVVAPILGGFLVARYSYNVSFLVGIILIFLSLFPLKFVPKTEVEYEFGFFETVREMFSKRFRYMTFAMMAFGAENVVGVVFWPIFLYTVFDGNYLEIGAFAAVIVIVGILFQLFMGQKADKSSKKKWLKWGTEVYALGWVGKAFVDTVTEVFVASTFHSFGSMLMKTPLNTMMYEQASDAGHYVDEYTVVREMALNLGRVLMLVVLLMIVSTFSIPAAFIAAAVVTLGISWMSGEKVELLQKTH